MSRFGGDIGQYPLHAVLTVNLKLGASRFAMELRFEETLDASPADPLVRQVAVVDQLAMLALRHRPDVTDDVRAHLVLRVYPHPVPPGLHAGNRALGHPQQAVFVETRRDHLRGQRVGALVGKTLAEPRGGHIEEVSQFGQHGFGVLLAVSRVVIGHHAGADVVCEHHAMAVEDAAARRRRDDDADLIRLRSRRELLRLEYLQVPQSGEQRSEQSHYHDADEGHPPADPLIHRAPCFLD